MSTATTSPEPPVSEWAGVCTKCTRVGGACSLHCPTLQLPKDTPLYEEKP